MKQTLLAAALAASSFASATIYYADPSGSTSNTGTNSLYPTTIDKATSLAAGDTLYLRGGTYYRTAPLYPHSGSSTAAVTIAKYPGETPIIDGAGIIPVTRPDKNTVGLGSYTVWDGVNLQNGINANISTWGSDHVTIQNIVSTGAYNSGILIGSGTRGTTNYPGSTDITISNCEIYNCCLINSARNAAHWTPALQTFQTHNLTISGCNVHNVYGEGIGLRTTSYATISNCTVTDAYSASVYLDNSAYITLSGNSTYSSNSGFYRSGHAASGLLMAVEPLPVVGGVTETQLGDIYITETSTNDWQGSPGRESYRYTYDSLSDFQDSTGTCSFNSTPTGLGGFPAIQNIVQ